MVVSAVVEVGVGGIQVGAYANDPAPDSTADDEQADTVVVKAV